MDRTVLHCDANAFFASCETVGHPEYAKVPMAVCGSQEDRHGIVLAKNELAKRCGVSTGEAIWQAKRKCPSLLVVEPSYGLYESFSAELSKIFCSYTDLVEPFGIDESWLDVTASRGLFGDGKKIADELRSRVKKELGITVSVGVSFNKVFAKLGSDMKKPDGTTVIPRESFRTMLDKLPASDLLFVGRRTAKALERIGIFTIGGIASAERRFLVDFFGKGGGMLWDYANGLDESPVHPAGYREAPKSVSNGMTFLHNLRSEGDISFAVNYLADTVAARMRQEKVKCRTISVAIRDCSLNWVLRQTAPDRPTNIAKEIAFYSLGLVKKNLPTDGEIYSLNVGASNLIAENDDNGQCCIFEDFDLASSQKRLKLETAVDGIRSRFGNRSVVMASFISNPLCHH